MEILDIIETEGSNIRGWVPYINDFTLELEYIPKESLSVILARCNKTVYRKHQPTVELDTKMLATEIRRYVIGWKGLTIETLRGLLPIKEDTVIPDDTEVAFSEKNLELLIDKVYGFDLFLIDSLTEIDKISKGRGEAEKKTSKATSSDD